MIQKSWLYNLKHSCLAIYQFRFWKPHLNWWIFLPPNDESYSESWVQPNEGRRNKMMQLSQFWDDFPLKTFSSERLHSGQADQLQEHQNSQGQQSEGRTVTCSPFACPEHSEQCQTKSRYRCMKIRLCELSLQLWWALRSSKPFVKDQVPDGCGREGLHLHTQNTRL